MFRYQIPQYDMKRSVIFLILFSLCGLVSVFKSAGIFAHQIMQLEWTVGGDKHLHFMVAFTLGLASVWVIPRNMRNFFGLCGIPTLILYIAVIADECSQYYLPRREFSLLDMATNVAGVSIGVIGYSLLCNLKACSFR